MLHEDLHVAGAHAHADEVAVLLPALHALAALVAVVGAGRLDDLAGLAEGLLLVPAQVLPTPSP